MASGRATRPTVIPAITSFKNLLKLYSRRQMTDLGSQRSSNFREMAGHIYTIMTAVADERNNQQGTKGRGGDSVARAPSPAILLFHSSLWPREPRIFFVI